MVNASELLRKNKKRVESINSKIGPSKAYDRPWRENLNTPVKSIQQKPISSEIKDEIDNSLEPKAKGKKSFERSKAVEDEFVETLTESKTVATENVSTKSKYQSSRLALYKYLFGALGSSDRAFQYLMLMEICDANQEIQLSQSQISVDLKINTLTVRRMLSDLLIQGFIEKTREHDAKTKGSAAFKLLKGFDASEYC